MGPSGSGKSTLMHILAGLDRPTRPRGARRGSMFSPRSSTSNESLVDTTGGGSAATPIALGHHFAMRRKGLAAIGVLLAAGSAALAFVLVRGGSAAPGETPQATFRDRNGDGVLERAGGEPLVDRTELAPRSRAVRRIALFAQLTDAHVVDEESPARLELLDRRGPPFTSAFRPQEALSGQVLAAAVRSLNALKPQAVVVTGDLIDNAQRNELDEALAILRGGLVDPNSGAPGYKGVQAASDPDPYYYRPDVDPPRHPGLLTRAERAFESPGLQSPWYPVAGNHDLLVQGNFAPTARTNAIATGARKILALNAAALHAVQGLRLTPAVVSQLLQHGLPGAAARVPADARRRELSAAETLAALRRASGHGGRGPLLDYAFDVGGMRGIVLDTIRRRGGASGLVRPTQVRWLGRRLRAAGGRPVIVFTHTPLTSSAGGTAALALLDRDSHVVAAVSGDTHRNQIRPHGHYWLVGTSSLADYPQQARAFELDRTAGGGYVLQTWMVDHDPADRNADTSRELAFLDFQGGRVQGLAGTRADRNARLYLR
jgi:3',5'-cyclic AMP phosphodiesterase CpdA